MYKSIAEIKAKNKEVGRYFFSANSMSFFASKIESGVIKGKYFITSEKNCFNNTNRAYTVREAREDGSIKTIGGFVGFETYDEAEDYLERI